MTNIAQSSNTAANRVYTLQDHGDYWMVIVQKLRYEHGRERSVTAAIYRPSRSFDSQGYMLTEDEARAIFQKRVKT